MKGHAKVTTNTIAATADVFHFLGILARVTRRIVDAEPNSKRERKP